MKFATATSTLKLLFVTVALSISTFVSAQDIPGDLQGARWLRTQMRYEEARQAFARWIESHPKDGEAHFDYGYTLMLQATAEKDEAKATALRKEAHALAQKAKALGYENAVLTLVLGATDENGTDLHDPGSFSAVPEAAALVKEGEQAFTSGKLDTAMTLYRKALALDPRSYAAVLFIADVYFTQKNYPEAEQWFGKAIALAPDRETAYRYLADTLVRQNRPREALTRYIEAVIAEPYNRLPREMLQRVAAPKGLGTPVFTLPQVTVTLKDGHPSITLPPPDQIPGPFSAALIGYGAARGTWLTDERKKYFPADAPVRHSLPEECYGLRFLADYFNPSASTKKDQKAADDLKATIQTIRSLDQEGLLEAFLLLDRPDPGIMQDYAAYRLAHRDDLVRYIMTIWLRDAGKPASR